MNPEPSMDIESAAPSPADRLRGVARRTVSARHLLAAALLVLLTANQLLLHFLDVELPIAVAAFAAGAGLLLLMLRLPLADEPRIGLGRLAGCLAVALVILALGGEGRLVYANTDWQIRDAVLRDLTLYSWPYAYTGRGAVELLRAPIGMYLLPAVAGKAGGVAVAEAAMLAQNAVLLGIVLALGSLLAETARARLVLLVVAIVFSGLDFLAMLRIDAAHALDATSHLDQWSPIQFSSHVTQAFWVPQHAIVGWIGAVLFLLWAKGRLPLVGFLAPLPLLALWSPLSLMGIMPFAAAAGLTTLLRRRLKVRDIAIPMLAAAAAVPALVYLQAAGDTVGIRAYPLSLPEWFFFQLIETIPFILGVALLATARRPRLLVALSATWLAAAPFIQIGGGIDFVMRASIPALAVLAALVAEALASRGGDYRADGGVSRGLLIGALAVGAITGLHEIARGLMYRPAPLTRCELVATTVAHGGPDGPAGLSTYVAPVSALPEPLRPKALELVPPTTGVRCWERPWMVKR